VRPIPPYDEQLLKVLSAAVDVTREYKRRVITPQHVLISLIQGGDAQTLARFEEARVNPGVVLQAVRGNIKMGRAKTRRVKSKADVFRATYTAVSRATTSLINQTPTASPNAVITLDELLIHWLANNCAILNKICGSTGEGRRASKNKDAHAKKPSSRGGRA
jgi:ATP-dependent Clp protease ATP-binding subunit ClpA